MVHPGTSLCPWGAELASAIAEFEPRSVERTRVHMYISSRAAGLGAAAANLLINRPRYRYRGRGRYPGRPIAI